MLHRTARSVVIFLCIAAGTGSAATLRADDPAYLSWARRSLDPITSLDMNASSSDLKPLRRIIGNARIVMFGEGQHFAAEPLEFRNRLFKYLVEDLGFEAIALESGVTEGRLVHD